MRRNGIKAGLAGILILFLAGFPASAAEAVDHCPLAQISYSADTPLIDLLIDPRARRLMDEAGVIAKLPAPLRSTTIPSFATIINLNWLASKTGLQRADLKALEERLAVLPIRRQDIIARCARYEASAQEARAVPVGRPAVLVFEKSTGFRDSPSVDAATGALRRIGESRGWHMEFTGRSSDFTPATLRQFDAVIWNNVSGDALTKGQRRAFREYIEEGGGFVGIHGSGGDPVYWWDWYADTLIGARFSGHPASHMVGRLAVESTHAITHGIEPDWSLKEEWYSFASSPRGSGTRVHVTLDESSLTMKADEAHLIMGDHPIAWSRCVGEGRSFYSAIGHRPEVYSDPRNLILMEQGIAWAMGLSPSECEQGSDTPADDG